MMAKPTKNAEQWETMLAAAAASADQFGGLIVLERMEVALLRVQRAEPRVYRRWLKATEATDLTSLAGICRELIVKIANAAEDQPEAGTEDGTDEETKGEDDGL